MSQRYYLHYLMLLPRLSIQHNRSPYSFVVCMRTALQRLLRSPSALGVLRNAIESPYDLTYLKALGGRRTYKHGFQATPVDIISTATSRAEDDTSANRGLTRKIDRRARLRKHDNRRPTRKIYIGAKNWSQHLVTIEQYQYESDLGNPAPKVSKPRLVDSLEHGTDFRLWLELARFRQRHYGIEGLQCIWNEISRRGLQLPCHGRIANELWESLLQLGFEFPRTLKEIEVYAKYQWALTGTRWPMLYTMILSYHLKMKPHHAYQWHVHLYKDFPPSLRQLKRLFSQAVMNERALGYFRRIYLELKIRHMYDTIVPELCARDNYAAAVKWHNLLLRNRDLPSNSSVSKPLLHYIAIYGRHEHLVEITKGMVDVGVSFAGPDRITYHRSPLISREIMNRQLGESHGVTPKTFGDEFCARLFATKMFTVDIVISGLRVLGIEIIGPLSLREIGLREKSKSWAICTRIDQLISAGISLGNSTFSTLVRRLALEDKRDLLNEVLTCDLHPDTFEDRNLQESLLVSYCQGGDKRQIDRTLAILTVHSAYTSLAVDHWNILLRVHLTRRNLKGIKQTLETMREMCLTVSPRSSSYVRTCMLSRRHVGKRPYRSDELPLVVNIWREVLHLGGIVPSIAWIEILKRLGMSGQLEDLEALSLWLADWYSKSAAQASQVGLTSTTMGDRIGSTSQTPVSLSPQHSLHPLHVIFDKGMQEAIITWGFQYTAIRATPKELSSSDSMDRLSWTWGLRLLQKLRHRNVMIARPTIARVCRQRLVSLFGSGLSNRKRNRRARQLNTSHLGLFLERIRELWGDDLLDKVYRLPVSSLHKLSLLERRTTAGSSIPPHGRRNS